VRNRRIRRLTALAALALAGFAWAASPATSDVKIRQVHPDDMGMFDSGDWVELQLTANGQTVAGRRLATYDPDGNEKSHFVIPSTPTLNTQSQRTVLISNTSSVGGTTPDFNAPLVGQPGEDVQMTGMDGAVCLTENNSPTFTPVDCVSYGSFTGTIPSAGMPASQTAFGETLQRTIAHGCPTALDEGDDTDNSAFDFSLSTDPPRNNSAAPTETTCPSAGGGGGGGGGNSNDKTPPQTKIGKVKVSGTTATVKFSGSDDQAGKLTFKCKLDKKKFKSCKSPKKFKHLKAGKHKVRVEAIDAAGNVDPSPAKKKFKV
jgi:hypothetical protein